MGRESVRLRNSPDMQAEAAAEREKLIENVAEADDALIEKYLEGQTLTDDEIKSTLRKGTIARLLRRFFGSATKEHRCRFADGFYRQLPALPFDSRPPHRQNGRRQRNGETFRPKCPILGVSSSRPWPIRMPGACRFFGSSAVHWAVTARSLMQPRTSKERLQSVADDQRAKSRKNVSEAEPGSILAVAKLKETTTGDTLCAENAKVKFITATPIPTLITFALQPKTKGDEDKILSSLNRLLEEDPGLKIDRSLETKEILLSGSGQVHIEATIEKLKRKFNVEGVI
jgi:elongation factor G